MEKDCSKVWSKCLSLIQEQLTPEEFKILFEPISALKLEGDILTIQVPCVEIYEILESKYFNVLRATLQAVIGLRTKLEYSIAIERNKSAESLTITIDSPSIRKPQINTIDSTHIKEAKLKNPFELESNRIYIDSQLNPIYTMESYIEGECNQLARSAGVTIAEESGSSAFNPLLIYGGVGLGKTHLAQAIGLEVKHHFPEKIVLYVSTNVLKTQYTKAVRSNNINSLLHFYQLIDVLIVDDIQELAGLPGTQIFFSNIFNHLDQLGKQLILTSSKAPSELRGIEERLLSRLNGGLSAEIKNPDFETRKKIVINKASRDGTDFSEDVINYICKHLNHNIRELKGMMIYLLAQSTFIKHDLTVHDVEEILRKIVKKPTDERTTDKMLQDTISDL